MKVSADQVDEKAKELGMAPIILECFCAIESSYECLAVRFEPGWSYLCQQHSFARKLGITEDTETQLQKFSWGPLQIMGSVAREHGFDGYLTALASADMGLHFGALHVVMVLGAHGLTTDAVAAYNAGTPTRGADGKYLNQEYVDRFLNEWLHRGGHVLNETQLVAP